MKNIKDLKLIVDYCDKSKCPNYTLSPVFEIKISPWITFANKPEEIIDYTSILLAVRSNPSLPKFKEIKLESKLEDEKFSNVNNTLKKKVKEYNHIHNPII